MDGVSALVGAACALLPLLAIVAKLAKSSGAQERDLAEARADIAKAATARDRLAAEATIARDAARDARISLKDDIQRLNTAIDAVARNNQHARELDQKDAGRVDEAIGGLRSSVQVLVERCNSLTSLYDQVLASQERQRTRPRTGGPGPGDSIGG